MRLLAKRDTGSSNPSSVIRLFPPSFSIGFSGVWYGVWCMVYGAWCMVHGALQVTFLTDTYMRASQIWAPSE